MTTSNLIAIYYAWYPDNWKECVPADSGNVSACPPGSITNCPGTNDHTTMFPNRWAGRYLPNLKGTESPTTELYSSIDEVTIRTQLALMKQAGIGGLAFSYWGSQKPITVIALGKLFSVLNSLTNPHPEIKISIYYEDQANRSISIIETDVQNIINNYGSSPYFLKINNKPVFWVYGNDTLSLAQKWNTIRTNKNIYVIQKEFLGTTWKSNLNLADSWHQYAPANRYVMTVAGTTKYASGVSAGFWRYHACSRLTRPDTTGDYSPFENALIQMKNDGAQLHILFWNEWEEDSGIEPATLFNHVEGGTGAFPQVGTPYGTKYIDLVAKYFVPQPLMKWKCSGSPNFTCVQAADGIYDTQAQCQIVCKPPVRWKCSGAPNYQCIEDPNGPYATFAECQTACKPPITKYRCTGSPDFKCVVDPNGPYATLAECQTACKPPIIESIVVTSPTVGSVYRIGESRVVRWTHTSGTGTNVKIELLKSGTVVKIIVSDTPNDGQMAWTIPSVTHSASYQIRIKSTTISYSGISGKFSIQ